jgi:hypothetical protein
MPGYVSPIPKVLVNLKDFLVLHNAFELVLTDTCVITIGQSTDRLVRDD